MKQDPLSRRQLLQGAVRASAVIALPMFAAACSKKELQCSDTTGMSPGDITARTALEYTDRSADPAKSCDGCALFTSAGAEACGSCSAVKGPIHPKGTCKAWAKKA